MAELNINFKDTILNLLEKKKYSSVKDILATMNPSDIAAIFDEFEEQQLPVTFRLLPKELAADAFAEMDPETQEHLIHGFSDTELKQVIDELYVDDAVELVEEMPANVVRRILSQANADMRRDINLILKYPDDSAGSIMTTEYVSLRPGMTISDAITNIRTTGVDKETIYTCYVTSNRKLVGLVSVKDLLLAKDNSTKVSEIMEENVISVNTHTDQEEVAKMISKYNFMAIPVVDSENRLVGIITFDDVMDVMEEETTEDLAILSGQTPTDKPYLKSNPFELFVHRIPWLLILMVSSTFTGMIINHFEAALAANVILTAFIPMLMGTGGNSGSQASVTVIRALSLGEIEFSDLPRVIFKEFATSVLCALALGLVCYGKLMLLDRLLLNNAELTSQVAFTVSLALAVTVIVAKIIGASLPILAEKLKLDPAVIASPFLTTCVDALCLLVYFGVATALLF
ncbi:MAG: magnesium transporter [Sphaerochaetaceae bacterium]|nr:magnesium transporter [Sphaerochaetaceae bacterium]